MSLCERLGMEHPIVGAGLGGGLARARLTGAIGESGGLGQLGIMPPPMMAAELAAHREQSTRPVAVHLLLPFARRGHWALAGDADAVVTFWGRPRRRSGGVWVHQCGSVEEARASADAGADGVIVQGVEAGGHVRGDIPALELLERTRAVLPAGFPIWLAGGVAEAEDVDSALAAAAEAVVVGTRFLLSDESHGHPGYKRRLLEANDTVLTGLFGAGWPAPHRVVRNAATARWLGEDGAEPRWLRAALQRGTAPALSRMPVALIQRAARAQRPGMPLLGPAAATVDDPDSLNDAGPLYAGECVAGSAMSGQRATRCEPWRARPDRCLRRAKPSDLLSAPTEAPPRRRAPGAGSWRQGPCQLERRRELSSSDPDTELKARQRKMWAAGDYPSMVETFLLPLGPRLVEACSIGEGMRGLDVAAGTGSASIPAARTGAEVTASDLTPELLEAGRTRADAEGLALDWVEAEDERLPFEDGSFDVVMSSIGAMFAPHHQDVTDELVRVCRPGGRIGLLSWTPEGMIGALFRTMGPFAPPPPPGAQPPPLWGSEDHVRELFGDRADWSALERENLELTAFERPRDLGEHFKERYGPTIVARKNAEKSGREGELDEALDRFSEEWNRGTPERARFELEYLVAVVGTRA